MTAQEKAKELVDRYLCVDDYNDLDLDLFCDECGMSNDAAKQCALIAVDEILENSHTSVFTNYWEEVKQLITQL